MLRPAKQHTSTAGSALRAYLDEQPYGLVGTILNGWTMVKLVHSLPSHTTIFTSKTETTDRSSYYLNAFAVCNTCGSIVLLTTATSSGVFTGTCCCTASKDLIRTGKILSTVNGRAGLLMFAPYCLRELGIPAGTSLKNSKPFKPIARVCPTASEEHTFMTVDANSPLLTALSIVIQQLLKSDLDITQWTKHAEDISKKAS